MSHWYDKDGNPRHYEGKDGAGTTLREARKLELYPSVTTISGIVHKEALVKWLQEESALAAASWCYGAGYRQSPFDVGVDERQWARDMIALARESVDQKADEGSVIHDTLERFHADPFSATPDEQRLCYAIIDCIKENTGLSLFDDFAPEVTFCNAAMGYAGTCDLHTPNNREGDKWVIDYKTKDEVTSKTRGYAGQAEQLAAYAHGLLIPEARLANIFIPRTAPPEGEPWPIKFYEHKDDMAWQRFIHACQLWQVTKKYGPYYKALTEQL